MIPARRERFHMTYDDDDDIDDGIEYDPVKRAREILADVRSRREPEPAITTEGELMTANHALLEAARQELDGDDPSLWQGAAETLDQFDALRRATARARNQPGRLA
jgi:hypothetical protein